MSLIKPASIAVSISLTLAATLSPALQAADIEGASDHPLVPRVAGSEILSYKYRQLEEVSIPTGVVERERDPENERRYVWKYPQAEKLEGEHWSIVYGMPEDASTLHIHRSYTKALQDAGFEILYSASGEELDGDNGYTFFAQNDTLRHPALSATHQRSAAEADFRYLAAAINHPEHGRVVVAVSTFNALRRSSGEVIGEFGRNPTIISVEVVQSGELEIEMEHRVLEPDALEQGLIVDGRIAVHNILFAFDSAEILPESGESLGHIAQLMKDRPELKLLVVGHTDSVGDFDYNLKLSFSRAEAVAKHLVTGHGIDDARLRAAGAGMMSPATSNRTEAGRDLNRRVELVEIVDS